MGNQLTEQQKKLIGEIHAEAALINDIHWSVQIRLLGSCLKWLEIQVWDRRSPETSYFEHNEAMVGASDFTEKLEDALAQLKKVRRELGCNLCH